MVRSRCGQHNHQQDDSGVDRLLCDPYHCKSLKPFALNRHLIGLLQAMYPTLVMMIVTMQDSVLAANSDNLPSRASGLCFAMPSRDAESRTSSEGRLPPPPPGLRRTLFTEAIEDEKDSSVKGFDEGFDTVCRVETKRRAETKSPTPSTEKSGARWGAMVGVVLPRKEGELSHMGKALGTR